MMFLRSRRSLPFLDYYQHQCPDWRLPDIQAGSLGEVRRWWLCLKGGILKDLAGIGESDLHQLWLQIQNKNRRSILLCIVYIPPDRGLSCLENELMPTYVKALSRNKDIVLTGDANCDLLLKTPKDDALRSFCTSVNARQLIDRPTRVTMTSRSLLDIVMVSNKDIVKPWGDLDLTISDHYLVYIVLDMKVPKPPPSTSQRGVSKTVLLTSSPLTSHEYHGKLWN